MNYILIHEHESGVTAYPFTSKSRKVASDHDEEEIARILGVGHDSKSGSERLTVALVEARPLNFDILKEENPKKPEE